MASSKWPSALNVIQDACAQLALPVPVAAATAADDVLAQQMLALLNWCGRRLIKPTGTNRWSALLKTWQLVTDPTKTLYDLPDDWDSFDNLTGWNTTSRLPMGGPASGPQWSMLRGIGMGPSTLNVVYRVRGNQFEIYSSPSTPQTISIDYSSRSWVQDTTVIPPQWRDRILNDADLLVYDRELLIAKLKLEFLTAKGFDTTSAQMQYNELEEQALNADSDAAVLNLGGSSGTPLIGEQNLPLTGYGV